MDSLLKLWATLTGFFTSSGAPLTIAVAAGSLIIIYLIVIIFKIPININLGPFKINIGKPKEEVKEITSVAPQSIFYLCNKKLVAEQVKNVVRKKQSEISKAEYYNYKAQMNYASEQILEMKSLMSDAFAEVLETKLEDNENVKSHKEYRNYQILMSIMTIEIIKQNIVKKSLKENHFEEMNGTIWEDFLDQKIDVTIAQMKEFTDIMYNPNLVSRKEISDINELRCRKQVSNMIRAIFIRAKEISILSHEKTVKLEEEIAEEIEKILEDSKCTLPKNQ